jgi:hypothetical protein
MKKEENLLFVFLDSVAQGSEGHSQTDGVGHTGQGTKVPQ